MKFFHLLTALTLATGVSLVEAAPVPLYSQANLRPTDRGAYQYASQELADDFVPLASGTVTSATWTGSYYGTPNTTGSEAFIIRFFSAGATPGAQIFSFSGIATLTPSAVNNTYYDYTLNFAGPALASGVQYWVDILSDAPASATNYAWAVSDDGSPLGAFRTNGGEWVDNSNNPSNQNGNRANQVFALYASAATVAAVPEPAPLALLAFAVVAELARRRRSHRATPTR